MEKNELCFSRAPWIRKIPIGVNWDTVLLWRLMASRWMIPYSCGVNLSIKQLIKRCTSIYLKGSKDFDAIFTGNDDAAIGILAALGEADIRVPEDVSVAGFDDFRMAPFMNPSLTTVRAPTEKVGQAAAEQLAKAFKRGTC